MARRVCRTVDRDGVVLVDRALHTGARAGDRTMSVGMRYRFEIERILITGDVLAGPKVHVTARIETAGHLDGVRSVQRDLQLARRAADNAALHVAESRQLERCIVPRRERDVAFVAVRHQIRAAFDRDRVVPGRPEVVERVRTGRRAAGNDAGVFIHVAAGMGRHRHGAGAFKRGVFAHVH